MIMNSKYPTQNEMDRAQEVIKVLFENDFYDALSYTLDTSVHSEYYRLGLGKWLIKHEDLCEKMGLFMSSGETKVCIQDEHNPRWVLKISFNRHSNPDFVSRKIDWDFCEKEVEYYRKACDNNLQDCFAATYQLGVINNIFISIQEAVTIDEDYFGEKFEDYVKDWYNKEDYENEEYYYDVVSEAAEDLDNDDRIYAVLGAESDNLVEFIQEHNINDLHEGNWGITDEGQCVLMDFSGYTC